MQIRPYSFQTKQNIQNRQTQPNFKSIMAIQGKSPNAISSLERAIKTISSKNTDAFLCPKSNLFIIHFTDRKNPKLREFKTFLETIEDYAKITLTLDPKKELSLVKNLEKGTVDFEHLLLLY